MAKELIINASLPEVRIALMEDGQIQELLIERQSDKGIVGNIYKGRVTRVLPGMQAAFVDVGLDKAAFLYVDDIYVHPKVMGEENEVHDDEYHEQHESQGENQEIAVEASSSAVIETAENQVSVETTESGNAEAATLEASELQAAEDFLEEQHLEHLNEESDEGFDDEGEDESDADESSDSENSENSENLEASANDENVAEAAPSEEGAAEEQAADAPATGLENLTQNQKPRNFKGRGRNRRRHGKGRNKDQKNQFAGGETSGESDESLPENFNEAVSETGNVESDRAQMEGVDKGATAQGRAKGTRPEFREQRGRDRRIKSKHSRPRAQANIADLLKEGQEVIVQIAKDPIATKGARLTCHVSLPGRHLVCMPSVDHVGVSRRIERDDERRRLRDFVERNRPRKMGFIVRTASGGKDPESWIKQDIDYLSKLWGEIRNKADEVSAPALVYEDLNSILRAIRDWVNEDIDKIIVDTRYHYNELMAFADRFMPSLHEKIELYQGDIPVFDAYGISSELYRSLEKRVWLKSGGYIVIDQAEALVAIDVNTGRYVGKKSLEDTILKTNIEAAEEIAYQLRLRNCGGIIICDFIDMERDENRMKVYRALDEALKKDRARPTIQKISELGLVEMTRKRTRDTIIRTLCEPCTHCEGKGFSKSSITVSYEILREIERLSIDREAKKILVSASENVINILAIDLRDAVDQLERRYNKSVYLQSVLDFHAEQFEVVTDRTQGKKQTQDIARQLRIERERSERKEKSKQRNKNDSFRNQEARNQNQANDRDDEQESAEATPPVPVVRPAGSFVTARASQPTPAEEGAPKVGGVIQPLTPEQRAEKAAAAAAAAALKAAEGGAETESDEDRQPEFNEASESPSQPSVDMDDEDQLAYLRAQAAQDAAIAGLANPNSGAGQNRGNRGQQNQRNGRGGQPGNRNQSFRNQRNGRGGQQNSGNNRFRPQNNRQQGQVPVNGNAMAFSEQAVSEKPEQVTAPSVPDYEVLNRDDGSSS